MSNQNTYVVLGKKTFEDLQTGKDKYKYEVHSVSKDKDIAEGSLFEYDGFWGSKLNQITGDGILRVVESRVIAFQGDYSKEKATAIVDAACENQNNIDVVWSKGKR